MKSHRHIIFLSITAIVIIISVILLKDIEIWGTKSQTHVINTDDKILSIAGVDYSRNNLPHELQMFLYNQDLSNFQSLQTMIKSFATKYANLKLTKGIDLNDTPSTEDFFATVVSEEEIEKYYLDNKDKYPNTPEGKLSAQVDLRTKKIGEVLEIETNKLLLNGELKILKKAPMMPLSIFNLDKFPSLGPDSAPIKLIVISNLTCLNCVKFNEQFSSLFENYKEKIQLTFIPQALTFTSSMGLVTKAALCAKTEGNDQYWKFHNAVFNEPRFRDVKEQDLFSTSQLLNFVFEKINLSPSAMISCIQDQAKSLEFLQYLKNINMLNFNQYPKAIVNGREMSVKDDLLKAIEQAL